MSCSQEPLIVSLFVPFFTSLPAYFFIYLFLPFFIFDFFVLSFYLSFYFFSFYNLFFTWSVMGKQNNTVKFGVPGFFDCSSVLGCSGMFRCSSVQGCSSVPVFRGVPVFRCSSVPGFSTCHRGWFSRFPVLK